jgi:YesN/AraC family two-component response regulator
VGTARNGRLAMAYIRRHRPDIVILDIFMPDMDGFETLRAIQEEFPGLRTIVVSGDGSSDPLLYLDMTTKLGAAAVLLKPFTVRQLLDVALV